jgi:hypothetical protein
VRKKIAISAIAVLAGLGTMASSCGPTYTVDGKGQSDVPGSPGVTCYWLEVDKSTSSESDDVENIQCYDKPTWDANEEGEHFVNSNGQRKTR